jgi:ferredoxin
MPVIRISNGTHFDAERGTSILDAALAQGIALEHSCRNGRCASCKAQVTHGTTSALRDGPSAAMIHGARWLLVGLGLQENQFRFDAFVSSD